MAANRTTIKPATRNPRPSKPRSKTLKRAPGRPVGAERQRLRETLLDAALRVFAAHGYRASTAREIALAARVTPALAHYYFGGKQELLQAVMEERLMPVLAGVRLNLGDAGDDARALAAGFVRAIGDAVRQHPWLPGLWLREIVSEDGSLRELLLARIAPMLPQMLAGKFAAAQRRGDIDRDLDPRLLVVSLIGLSLFPLATEPLWRRIFAAEDIDATVLTRHTLKLLSSGLNVSNRGETA
jgi:TetR/AcrR family transcriptional regulator